MITWKEKPRRFVEPPLITHLECQAYRQTTKKETDVSKAHAHQTMERLGSEMTKNNGYFNYFKKEDCGPVTEELVHTYDKLKDATEFSPRTHRDTNHPTYTASARRSCQVSLQTRWQIRSSQAYGRLPPIDQPTYGFGRSPMFMDSAMDKSHLQAGGPWTAR
eukprot:TRINITY_DN50598_c0_g1_i1.p1 TRINITY_DN50598_c0_g1~~TRINITY_DN50598_c0_g1_i1.p1  ORF type:complete len:162 (+),score=31.07 TRINITY_DN50598_c0_g1_i1:106-591(+)